MAPDPADEELAKRLILPYLDDALELVGSGYATPDTVDSAMRLGAGHPRGPFELMEELGLPVPPSSPHRDPSPPPDRAVERVAVVGTGVVGSGLVETAARSGFTVLCWGRSDESCRRGRDAVTDSLALSVERGKLSGEEAEAARSRIRWTTKLDDLSPADLAVEAVAENPAVKREVFRGLDRATEPSCILATATSSLSVQALADETGRPERVLGMHFFNPVPVMRLVEVVRTADTADATLAAAVEAAQRMGKECVVCPDRPGFIVNRLLFPYLNDSVRLMESGDASADAIDDAVTSRFDHPMGPVALLDLIGLDVAVQILRTLHDAFGDPRLVPSSLLDDKVRQGKLGRKTGSGLRAGG